MHHTPVAHNYQLPALADLGTDLLLTTPRQCRVALLRPFIGVLAYVLAAYFDLWPLTPMIIFLTFVAVVTVTHDVVHGTLDLTRHQSEWALFLMGAVLMESGHAYRTTHRQHHTTFPNDDDPEGYPAKMRMAGAILYGPIFLTRLWLWAFQQNRGRRDQRLWLIVEALLPFFVVILGIALWQQTPYILLYAAFAIIGSWVYPLLTVYLPHKDFGDTPLTQTHTLRGRIIPAIFLELTYHLEHHLYPQVPSHHLAELARRLDPFFEQAGVEVWHVL